jgi:TonB-dependent starch-binding outer membrane protein SusC
LKKLKGLHWTNLIKVCPENSFRIIKVAFLLFIVTVLNVSGSNTFSSKSNSDKATDAASTIQQNRIAGTVTDEKGNPIPGVTILVKGTTNGSITDSSGKYVINNVTQKASLIFSFVGISTQEIPLNGRILIDVVLKEEAIELNKLLLSDMAP